MNAKLQLVTLNTTVLCKKIKLQSVWYIIVLTQIEQYNILPTHVHIQFTVPYIFICNYILRES